MEKWAINTCFNVLFAQSNKQKNTKKETSKKKKKHLICDAISSVYNVISYNLITELNFYDHVTVL